MTDSQAPLTANDYWTADQLRVMRGLELPAWFSPVQRSASMGETAVLQVPATPVSAPELAPAPAPTRLQEPEPLHALDAASLSAAAAQCQACPLGQSASACRRPMHLGDAKTSAQWLIVLDDATGQAPLLSDAEQVLLGNMLASVGKHWGDVAVTSLLKCARGSNVSLDAFSDEVQACQAFLQQQIALLKPQLLIAMGSLAGQALLGVDDEPAQLMDEVHEYEGVPLLVMSHPSELVEQSALKAQAWKSLNKV